MKALILLLALSGCASVPEGVEMSTEETTACKAQGCTVWTVDELKVILKRAFESGYRVGYEFGVKSL